MSPPSGKPGKRYWAWAGLRLVLIFALLTGLSLIFALLSNGLEAGWNGATISISLLFGLPFTVGALGTYLLSLLSIDKQRTFDKYRLWLLLAVLVAGSFVLSEAIICVLMILPFWVFSGWIGALCVQGLRRRFQGRHRINCSVLAALPFLMLGLEAQLPQTGKDFVVARSITIDAPAKVVRPLLFEMNNIQRHEGRWNITQDVLGVPRPKSAVVTFGSGGPRRLARWEDGVSFEEHIFAQTDDSLRWEFVFPNDSVSHRSDRHISPDGPHLKIMTGGYELAALPDGRTRLTLDTSYRATTPVNTYAALWGELILGDIQSNVLAAIKRRGERNSG
ncbi:hypothetical protein [Henriciella sp.]|uniref:hypothetical protein n=1 Tax=Henriciella sp. TaxID=1968823 RepID=UPI00260A5CE4|nr:hypothetical protein [Henriciella sp.]